MSRRRQQRRLPPQERGKLRHYARRLKPPSPQAPEPDEIHRLMAPSATKGEPAAEPPSPAAYSGTSIEKLVEAMLRELDVPFVTQYPILPDCRVDFFLPEHNLVIECHGTYYHADPRVYGEDESHLNPLQRRKRRQDAALAHYLRRFGFRLLVLWEKDLREAPEACRERLREVIANEDSNLFPAS